MCFSYPTGTPPNEESGPLANTTSSTPLTSLPTAISKMVTRLVRDNDQEERQSDAAVHGDTMRPKLLRVFADRGARDFSETDWLRHIHEGSSKTRFEYCEDSKNSLAYFRAIQAHSGGIPIDPELMGYIRIPYNWKEYIFTGVVLSTSNPSLRTEGRQTIFFTSLNPFGKIQM